MKNSDDLSMQRQITQELLTWKNDPARTPLILKGVRQCGKTWLLKQFGKEHFTDTAYFNFEGDSALHSVFAADLNPDRILNELGVLRDSKIFPGTTLLIFDEIQFCPAALTSLKYFAENLPTQHIACAGSLLGIELATSQRHVSLPAEQPDADTEKQIELSFPVGKVRLLTLYPMNFPEFLKANGKDLLLPYLKAIPPSGPVPQSIFPKLRRLYRDYLIIGGMPEAVLSWTITHDISRVEDVHRKILQSYVLDFAKHAPLKDLPKLNLIWDAIPQQLAKDNHRFIFSHAKPGARAKDLEDALQWLIDAGLVYKVKKVERPGIPLSTYADEAYFKLYLVDVGLLRTLSKFPAEALLVKDPLTSHMRGALTENYVLTELITQGVQDVFFWKSNNKAEVDFVVQEGANVVPVEVKSAENTRSKSLARYRELYAPEISVRTSLAEMQLWWDEARALLDLPLMLVWRLRDLVKEIEKKDIAEYPASAESNDSCTVKDHCNKVYGDYGAEPVFTVGVHRITNADLFQNVIEYGSSLKDTSLPDTYYKHGWLLATSPILDVDRSTTDPGYQEYLKERKNREERINNKNCRNDWITFRLVVEGVTNEWSYKILRKSFGNIDVERFIKKREEILSYAAKISNASCTVKDHSSKIYGDYGTEPEFTVGVHRIENADLFQNVIKYGSSLQNRYALTQSMDKIDLENCRSDWFTFRLIAEGAASKWSVETLQDHFGDDDVDQFIKKRAEILSYAEKISKNAEQYLKEIENGNSTEAGV